jgi:hydroxymethylbilane synthase
MTLPNDPGPRRRRRALRLGTRRSALAMAQSRTIADLVAARSGLPVELVEITTFGDVSREHMSTIGGTGVFVSALRDALLAGEVDFVVHSLKDLPTTPAKDLTLAAVPGREDPRDALVAAGGLRLADLPAGARVGTGAARRAAQLRAARPDLEVLPLRGNVDTRVGKVRSGELDAVVVARAGLARLGRVAEATEILDVDIMLPAPGQGALAVECREPHQAAAGSSLADAASGAQDYGAGPLTDAQLCSVLRGLDDAHARAAVLAERALLAELEAGCHAPVGAYAIVVPGAEVGTGPANAPASAAGLLLDGAVFAPDGTRVLRVSTTGPLDDPVRLGRELAIELLDQGAAGLMGECFP